MEKFVRGHFLYPLNDRRVLVKYEFDHVAAPVVEVVDVEFNAIPAVAALEDLKPSDTAEICVAILKDVRSI